MISCYTCNSFEVVCSTIGKISILAPNESQAVLDDILRRISPMVSSSKLGILFKVDGGKVCDHAN